MTFYKEEKKRIGIGRWGYVCFVWLLYFLYFWMSGKSISLMPETIREWIMFLVFIIFTINYVNDKLFFIKEQGERMYLIKKYEIVPISVREIFLTKIRIMTETVVVSILGMIVVSIMIIFLFEQSVEMSDFALWILFITVFAAAYMAIIVFFVDIVQGEWGRRKG